MNNNSIYKYENVRWSIPILFDSEPIWAAIYRRSKKCGINLKEVKLYGSPNCLWGKRKNNSQIKLSVISNVFDYIIETSGIPTIAFDYSTISIKDLDDEYSNLILELGIKKGCDFLWNKEEEEE